MELEDAVRAASERVAGLVESRLGWPAAEPPQELPLAGGSWYQVSISPVEPMAQMLCWYLIERGWAESRTGEGVEQAVIALPKPWAERLDLLARDLGSSVSVLRWDALYTTPAGETRPPAGYLAERYLSR